MKKNCIPGPAYYFAVAIVIVVFVILTTIFQGCAVYNVTTVGGKPLMVRGGWYNYDYYLRGYAANPDIATGGYHLTSFWSIDIPMPGKLEAGADEKGVQYYNRGTEPLLTKFTNRTGKTVAVDLYYPDDNGQLIPIARKNGEAWNRIILRPGELKVRYISEGQLTYNVYLLGRGEDRSKPTVTFTDDVHVTANIFDDGCWHAISVYGFKYNYEK